MSLLLDFEDSARDRCFDCGYSFETVQCAYTGVDNGRQRPTAPVALSCVHPCYRLLMDGHDGDSVTAEAYKE